MGNIIMITLTRLNGTELLLNEKFIEIAEQTPDTVVTMQNSHRYVVKESLEDIRKQIADIETFYSIKTAEAVISLRK